MTGTLTNCRLTLRDRNARPLSRVGGLGRQKGRASVGRVVVDPGVKGCSPGPSNGTTEVPGGRSFTPGGRRRRSWPPSNTPKSRRYTQPPTGLQGRPLTRPGVVKSTPAWTYGPTGAATYRFFTPGGTGSEPVRDLASRHSTSGAPSGVIRCDVPLKWGT